MQWYSSQMQHCCLRAGSSRRAINLRQVTQFTWSCVAEHLKPLRVAMHSRHFSSPPESDSALKSDPFLFFLVALFGALLLVRMTPGALPLLSNVVSTVLFLGLVPVAYWISTLSIPNMLFFLASSSSSLLLLSSG